MKLVRPHQILCFLRNPAVLRGQKFRTHRCVQHIKKHIRQLLFPACIRIVADQMADQGLGNRPIDTIHGHVIAVIGSPSQRKLRHVTGSYYQTSHLIGNIHEDLGSFPGLAVFIGHIMPVHIMTDIFKMACHRFPYINFTKFRPHLSRQSAGIIISPVRGPEAGHGYAMYAGPGYLKTVKCPHGHQQSQRGVKSSRQSYHCFTASRVLQALLKAHGLNGKNLLTAPVSLSLIPGHKGSRVHIPKHITAWL